MMIHRDRNLFIYRPLSPASADKVLEVQDQYSCIESFQPVTDLHLTLHKEDNIKKMQRSSRESIISQAPPSTALSYEMRVIATQLHTGSKKMSNFAIALMLENNDGFYNEEHTAFRSLAAQQTGRYPFVARDAHVTLGYVHPEFALQSILEPADALIGHYLSFEAAESNIGKVLRPPVEPTSLTAPLPPAQSIRPGSIPSSFLASLRSPSTKPNIS